MKTSGELTLSKGVRKIQGTRQKGWSSSFQKETKMKLKPFVLTLALISTTSCATLQSENTPPTTPTTPIEQPVPTGNRRIVIPDWPTISYMTETKDAFVILGVKDPKTFPVPEQLNFTDKEGKIYPMKPVVKDKK